MRKSFKRRGGKLNKNIGKNAFVISPTYPKSVANWPAWGASLHQSPGPSCKGNYFKYNNKPNLSYPKYVGGKSKRRRHKQHKRRRTRYKQYKKKTKRKHSQHSKKSKKNKRYKGGARWSWSFPFNGIEHGLYSNSKYLYNAFFGKPTGNIGQTNLNPNYQSQQYSYN